MRTLVGLSLALVTPLMLLGCDGGNQNPLTVLMTGDGALTVSVTTEAGPLTPTYRWTGDRARSLTVRELGTDRVMWRIEAVDLDAGFPAPVRHAVVPPGARQTSSAGLLEVGSRYQVTVVGLEGQSGSAQFTP